MKGILVLLSLWASEPQGEAWPQFRGPAGTGVALGKIAPVQIGPGKNQKWVVSIPTGVSSPCIVGNAIFLTGFDQGKLLVFCLDRATGAEKWRREVPAKEIEPYHKTEGSPAASTCAAQGDRVVSYFGSCGLFCHSTTGELLWSVPMACAKTQNDFGTGTSPIIAEGKVLLARDLTTGSDLYAYDLRTGAEVWKTHREGFVSGWSTPTVWKTAHDTLVVVPGGIRMKSYDLHTGKEKWVLRDMPAVACTTAVVAGENLVFAGWGPGGEDFRMPSFADLCKDADTDKNQALSREEAAKTMLKDFFDSNDQNKDGRLTADEWDTQVEYLRSGKNALMVVKPGGSGDITASHVAWRRTKGLPYVPSPVVVGDKVWMIRTGGFATCVTLAGEPIYEQKRALTNGDYYSSPVASGNHLYAISTAGDLSVLPLAGEPKAVWKASFKEPVSATPAIVHGHVYVRTQTKLYAFGE